MLEGPDGKVAGIEVKASASPSSSNAKHLRWLKDKLGDKMTAGVVLHLGNTAGSLGNGLYGHLEAGAKPEADSAPDGGRSGVNPTPKWGSFRMVDAMHRF